MLFLWVKIIYKRSLYEKYKTIKSKRIDCRSYKRNHELRFMIGELDGFETLLPAKFSIWYDKKSKSYIASLVTLLWKSYAKNPTIIPFSKISEYLKIDLTE